MNILRVSILALTFTALLPSSSQAQTWLTNGLVAYYPFNGNANDASGNNRHGTNFGAQFTTDRFGAANSACFFNGTSSYIAAGLGTFSYYPLTFSAWFASTHVVAVTRGIVSIPSCLSCSGARLGLENGQVEGGSMGGSGPQDLFSPFAADGKWHHALVAADSSGLNRLYLDGVLVDTSQRTPGGASSLPLQIGRELIASELRNILGHIDDVRIYNRALSSNEVASLYYYESRKKVQMVKFYNLNFDGLLVGTNYQLQASTNLLSWTNWGAPFTATSDRYTNTIPFQRVDDWNKLFFRLIP